MGSYKRAHHNLIDKILRSMNADVLLAHSCFFAGGTAISLRYGEFRESVDIDFLISDATAYSKLRKLIFGRGLAPLFQEGTEVQHTEVRADAYGVRTVILYADARIKFEIVPIDLLVLEAPDQNDRISTVACITPVDMVATKLIANADRGEDKTYLNRDVIDLALMGVHRKVFAGGVAKAVAAQGYRVKQALADQADRLLTNDQWLHECRQRLAIEFSLVLIRVKLKAMLVQLKATTRV